MAETSVGVYLFSRLGELGIKSISGVPGGMRFPLCFFFSDSANQFTLIDYELVLLDMIPEAGLTWHGNANELIAGYAVRYTLLAMPSGC